MYKKLTDQEQKMLDEAYRTTDTTTPTPKGSLKSMLGVILIFATFVAACSLFFYLLGLRKGSFNQEQINSQSQIYQQLTDTIKTNP